ncbi:MAG: DUF4397 domain-containing protein [Ignavibacteria bacterium]|nr:DUF4397 domain-containing protein [Ignavibacteria bacterium]
MKPTHTLSFITCLALIGCASEDPNIVNPPPGSEKIIVRLLNLVPDDVDRKLLLDKGYQSEFIAPGAISDTVQAPSDSSFIEIIGDSSEFKSVRRFRFTQQSVYDVIALGKPNTALNAFDTIMVSNANVALTTLPVAQLRLINAFPDTTSTFDLRIGCPNGQSIGGAPTPFRQSTLYTELPPGLNVLTLLSTSSGVTTVVSTFECILVERTPYSVVVKQSLGASAPNIFFYSEADFSSGAERPITPVLVRDADIRVCNVGQSSVTVTLLGTNQLLASDILPQTINAYVSVQTCEKESADVFEARYTDGRVGIDSTALVVGGQYTLVATDSANDARIVIIPPRPVVYGASGKAIVRVVNASASAGAVSMSVGARSSTTSSSGIESGLQLSANRQFNTISLPVIVEPGEIPITVANSTSPTSMKLIGRTFLLPDRSYIFLLANESNGLLAINIIDEGDIPGSLTPAEDATLLRFVNGSAAEEYNVVSVGTVVQGGRVPYRNSFATSVPIGIVPVAVGSISTTIQTVEGQRSLLIYAIRENQGSKLIEIASDPLRQIPGISDRRVINATADLQFVSVSYDTNFRSGGSSETVATEVPFGQTSPVFTLERDRRGTMYFYDSQTLKDIYSLPIGFGPLGNSYSLIVTGTRQAGYEVIVLQEL